MLRIQHYVGGQFSTPLKLLTFFFSSNLQFNQLYFVFSNMFVIIVVCGNYGHFTAFPFLLHYFFQRVFSFQEDIHVYLYIDFQEI